MFNLFVRNRMVWLKRHSWCDGVRLRLADVQYCCADGASLFELLMRVDQLIKAIDVRWVDLEDSRLYGVEEIGRRGSESFWSHSSFGHTTNPRSVINDGRRLLADSPSPSFSAA